MIYIFNVMCALSLQLKQLRILIALLSRVVLSLKNKIFVKTITDIPVHILLRDSRCAGNSQDSLANFCEYDPNLA
jgi:hypothetical protein